MIVTVKNDLVFENVSLEFIRWVKQNLILANPEYAKKARMGFWLGKTPRELYLYQTDGEKYILPYGCLKLIPKEILQECYVLENHHTATKVDMGSTDDMGLYDYQELAVAKMIEGKNGILQAPTGSGKTNVAIGVIKALGLKALWLTHTHDLLNQSYDRAKLYIDESLLGKITEGKVNIGKGMTVATIQTMAKLDLERYRDLWDVVIVDECFPKGTKIITAYGSKPIEKVKQGDIVLTFNEQTSQLEYKRVEELQIRERKNNLLKINFSNCKSVSCTENHPFYTKRGWIKGGELNDNDEVLYLREGILCRKSLEQNSRIIFKERRKNTLLFKGMLSKRTYHARCLDRRKKGKGKTKSYIDQQEIWIRKNDKEKSDAFRTSKKEGKPIFESDELEASYTRWKWSRTNSSSKTPTGKPERIQSVSRICCNYSRKKRRLSNSLQNRYSIAKLQNCYRSGRKFSLPPSSTSSRPKKRTFLEWVRVESIEVQKQNCDGKYRGLCEGNRVYNLSVEGNHNYFANNILVHNCHKAVGTPTALTQFYKVLSNLDAKYKFGLSATVHRADGLIKATFALLGKVIYEVPEEMVADKRMQVGIKTIATGVPISDACLETDGTLNYTKLIDYLTKSVRRNILIAESIIENKDHSCLILSDRLEHLKLLMNILPSDMEEKAVMISGKMTTKKGKAEREKAIEDMREGKKKYLFATYSLCKEGLDIPRLDRLFMASIQKDYAVVTQSIGRIARKATNKKDAIVYDFLDDIGYCNKAYKARLRHYKKAGCYMKGDK